MFGLENNYYIAEVEFREGEDPQEHLSKEVSILQTKALRFGNAMHVFSAYFMTNIVFNVLHALTF